MCKIPSVVPVPQGIEGPPPKRNAVGSIPIWDVLARLMKALNESRQAVVKSRKLPAFYCMF